jgi:hypothetical protein
MIGVYKNKESVEFIFSDGATKITPYDREDRFKLDFTENRICEGAIKLLVRDQKNLLRWLINHMD